MTRCSVTLARHYSLLFQYADLYSSYRLRKVAQNNGLNLQFEAHSNAEVRCAIERCAVAIRAKQFQSLSIREKRPSLSS